MAHDRSRGTPAGICLLGLLPILVSLHLFAQSKETSSPTPPDRKALFRVEANSVVVKVAVTDKNENPVTDLAEEEFRIYDDNRLQTIQTFQMELTGGEETDVRTTSGPLSENTAAQVKNARTPRWITLVIDDLTMESVKEFPRVVGAAKEFVENILMPGDQVSILSGSREVQFPFTDNRQKLLEELDSIPTQLNFELPFRFCPGITGLEAWSITAMNRNSIYYCQLVYQCAGRTPPDPCALITHGDMNTGNDTLSREEEMLNQYAVQTNEYGEMRTRSFINTLLQYMRSLRHFEGNKSVVIFSYGFLAEGGTRASYQMQDLVNTALRSDIVLNTVSLQGITTHDNEELADPRQRWRISMREDDKMARHASLARLAEDTGGSFHQDNSYVQPLEKILRKPSAYYLLTYNMPAHKPDGSYHDIRVDITRPGVEFRHRKGYYAAKEEMTYENSKREDILDALNAPGNMNEIPMTLSYNFYRENTAAYAASFISTVNIGGMRFSREDDRMRNQVSLILAAYDEKDTFINGMEKAIDFQLLEDSYEELLARGIRSKVELKLSPGRYRIKAVVREGNQGKMGSASRTIDIP
jgi:VWFA-related protein